MKVDIVIPNWNGKNKLSRNLPSVFDALKDYKSRIIVVDDASPDDSVAFLKKDFPQVYLIEKKVNSGFSTTVNLGVEASDADFVVLLNSDASPHKNFLKSALKHFNNNKVFSVSCNVGGGYSVGSFKNGYFWHNQRQISTKEKNHIALWSSGGSGIFRKKIWNKLHGLDELFNPFYEEDVDLGYRSYKRGYINIWDSESHVDHYKEPGVIASNFSRKYVEKIAQRNQLIFIWKNITSNDLLSKHKIALYKMMLSHPKYILTVYNAYKLRNIIKDKRKVEMSESVVTDEEIFSLFK